MRILGVGTATLDIINRVDSYPAEDSEVRAIEQRICRGGNVSNTLVVLSQLGHDCCWAGCIADDPESRHICDDLEKSGVALDCSVPAAGGRTPVSYVTLSVENGSRTIIHFRNLPEYGFQEFMSVDLDRFDWVHFEGRNVPDLESMLRRVGEQKVRGCSIEVEKPRAGIERLFRRASLLMFSHGYAEYRGFRDGASFLSAIRGDGLSGVTMTCSWGAAGAWAIDGEGRLWHRKPPSVDSPLDTLGAGDVFNAGLLSGLLSQSELPVALNDACRLAARKVGQYGFAGLVPGSC